MLCGTITSKFTVSGNGANGNQAVIQWDTGASVQVCANNDGIIRVNGNSYLVFDLGGNSSAITCPNNGTGMSTSYNCIAAFSTGNCSSNNWNWGGWANVEIRNGTIGPLFIYNGDNSDNGFQSTCIGVGSGGQNTYVHHVTFKGCFAVLDIIPTSTSTDEFAFNTTDTSVGRLVNYHPGTGNYTDTLLFHDNDVTYGSIWSVQGDYEHVEEIHSFNSGNAGDQDKVINKIYNNYFHGASPSAPQNVGSTALIFLGEGGNACNANSTQTGYAFNNLIVDTSTDVNAGFSQGSGGYFYDQDCEQTWHVWNNTIYTNGTSNPCFRLEVPSGSANTWDAQNNICNGKNSSTGMTWGAYFASLPGTKTFDYNDYYQISSNSNRQWQIGGTNYTFAQWQTQVNGESHSFQTDPGLDSNYRITSTGSSTYHTGTNLYNQIPEINTGPPQNFGVNWSCGTGCVARSATDPWDIGAYPYGTSGTTSQKISGGVKVSGVTVK